MPSKITEYHAFIFKIYDSEITLLINFLDEYGREDFQKDLDEFIKIHSLKKKPAQFREYELPIVRKITKTVIAKKGLFDYDYFKTSVIAFLHRIVRDILQDMPELLDISSKELEIRISITSSEKRKRYAYHDEKASDKGRIILELGGGILLDRIIAQKHFIGRMNYRFIEKILFHEFRHHMELLREVYKKEYEKYEKLKSEMLQKYKRLNIGRLALHTVLCNLFTEGLAEFYVMKRASKIDINMEWIRGFKSKLRELIALQTDEAVETYSEENLDAEHGPTVYYCGKMMCYFIGLSIAKKKEKKIRVCVGKQVLDISKLNETMNANKRFSTDQLPENIYRETLSLLNSITYYKKFITKYEEACSELGIEENNRILTKKEISEIKKESKEIFTKYLLAGLPPRTSRLHLWRERIKHFFYSQPSQQSQPSGSQKPS